MGRKKQVAKNDSDAAPADVAPGHNKPELTEDEKRVLLYQHKAAYTTANKAVADAKAELLRVCKLAKTECGKEAVADIKELLLLEQPKGGEALRATIERQLRLARWANASVGTQFNFSDFDGTPEVDRARELGKTSGLKGEPKIPPYDASVPQYSAWCDGWQEGQAVALSNFRDKLKPLNEKPAADASQMDLSEREDLPPEGAPNTADVSDPPFMPPGDDSDIPAALRRMPAAPAQPQ